MKTRIPFHFLIFIVLVLSACVQTSQAKPVVDVTPKADQMNSLVRVETVIEVGIEPETVQDIDGTCTRNSNKKRLLINFVHGYCLQYPVEYDVTFANANQVMFFKGSILNTSEPNFHIDVQPAGGMTVEQAADKIAEVYAIPGSEPRRMELSLGGEKAIMLDGLSGQDPNRQVVVLHEDSLYTLFFMQMDKNQPKVYAQAEALYGTVIQSFNFRPETNACPDCLPPAKDGGEISK